MVLWLPDKWLKCENLLCENSIRMTGPKTCSKTIRSHSTQFFCTFFFFTQSCNSFTWFVFVSMTTSRTVNDRVPTWWLGSGTGFMCCCNNLTHTRGQVVIEEFRFALERFIHYNNEVVISASPSTASCPKDLTTNNGWSTVANVHCITQVFYVL